jgi:AraC-like DNA-binding protein
LKILELIIICDRQLKLEEGMSPNGNQPLIVNYMSAVQEHYKKHHATSYYAGRLNVHPNSLNAAVKRYMGMSAKSVITSRLVNEAKSLLHLTALSVKEVAYELVFNLHLIFSVFSSSTAAILRSRIASVWKRSRLNTYSS